jgi:LysM repeat protein
MLACVCSVVAAQIATAASYTVKPGDGLERIARRHGCTLEALAKANGLKRDAVIHAGQTLKLPDKAGAAPAAAPEKATKPEKKTAAAVGGTHTIRQGDTLSAISRKYGVSVEQLLAANPGLKANSLRPGKEIRLSSATEPIAAATAPAPAAPAAPKPAPAPKTAPAAPPTPTAPEPAPATTLAPAAQKPEPAPEVAAETMPMTAPAQETAPAPEPEKKIHTVIVESEMTFGEFAAKHGTDTNRLNELNGLDLTAATVLAKGSELYVPAQP